MKKLNPQDLTLRNLRSVHRALTAMKLRVLALSLRVSLLEAKAKAKRAAR